MRNHRPPALTPGRTGNQDADIREALLEFVRALARQQAYDDHLAELEQDHADTRRDLRPL